MSSRAPEPAPLRNDARRVLDIWSEEHTMPPAAAARVWRRLQQTEQRQFARPRAIVWALPFALAAAVLAAWWGAATMLKISRVEPTGPAAEQAVDDLQADRPASADTVQPARTEPVAPAMPPALDRPTATPPPPAAVTTARRPSARPEAAVPAIERGATTPTLARERDLIARAWSALVEGDLEAALRDVATHARDFPNGLLTPERAAIGVIAGCKRGDKNATVDAHRWLAAQPHSPLATRVRAACIVDATAPSP